MGAPLGGAHLERRRWCHTGGDTCVAGARGWTTGGPAMPVPGDARFPTSGAPGVIRVRVSGLVVDSHFRNALPDDLQDKLDSG